jgi:lambda repressor-like predicted transcriptional regulator
MSTVADNPNKGAAVGEFARYLQAFVECNNEIQNLVLEMAAIVSDESTTDEERELASDAMMQALFPGDSADGLEYYKAILASPDGRSAAAAIAEQQATFADNLRRIMAAKGITQEQLASLTGVGQPAISNMLKRACRPQQRTVRRFAEALGVGPHDLWPMIGD